MDTNVNVSTLRGSNFSTSTSTSLGTFRAWMVCISAALFFYYDFIQLLMCNSISKALMRDFGIGASQLSTLSSSFLLADVAFLFPAGLILDRVSTRKITLTMLILSICATVGFAMASNFWLACSFRFLGGIAHAFCFLCCLSLASHWFPPKKQALVVGVIVTIAMMGGFTAQTPLLTLSEWIGWRDALLMNAALGLCILGLNWYYVYDSPEDRAEFHKQHRQELNNMGFWTSLLRAVSNIQNWLYGIYTGLLNLPIMIIGAVFGVLYLTQVRNIGDVEATQITSMIFIGTIIGAPLSGWISGKWGKRRAPMLYGALISLGLIAYLLYGPELSSNALFALFFSIGLITSVQVISYPAVTETNEKALSSTAMGLVSFLIMGSGLLGQKGSGWLLELYWDKTVVDGVSIYSKFDFLLSFSFMTVGFIVALIATFLIKETYCKSIAEESSS